MLLKIKYLLQALLVPISFLFYFYAPNEYSPLLCNTYLVIFLISSINLLARNLNGNIIVFEIFFLFAFYFTNFVYPTLYYLIDPHFSLFTLPFNETYITKGTALATLGITSFNLGIYQLYNEKKHLKSDNIIISQKTQKNKYLIILLLIIFFSLFIYNMMDILLQGIYTMTWGSSSLLIFEVLIYLIYYLIFVEFKKNNGKSLYSLLTNSNKVALLIIIITIILLLYIGSRTIPMRIILLTLCLYSYFNKPIKIKYFLPIFISGFFLMYVVGEIRSSSDKSSAINTISNTENIFKIGNELTINNRSLYVLMEHANKQGNTYGENFLMNILSVVPFLQSIVLDNFDVKLSDISSANFVTDQIYSNNDPKRIGLGTNLIGDIYLAFGSVGVLVLMFFLGFIIQIIHFNASRKDPIYILLYSLIFMDAVYYTRSSYLTPLRNIAWIFILYKLDSLNFKKLNPNI